MQDDEFIAKYESMVRRLAEQTRAQLAATCELEDLIAFGYQGLLEARNRFDAERGVRFRTFAYYRVRGAIIDGIRRMAYLPRRAHARLRALEALDAEGESLLSSDATANERTPDTAGTLRVIDGVLGRVAAAYCVAQTANDEGDGEQAGSPEQTVLRRERADAVQKALAKLSEHERQLVVGHDMQGRRLDEIGQQLGISKSWASRIHSRALDKLRRHLQRV